MKKRFQQLLAILLSLAMAVAVAPAQPAQAASKPKLNATKKTLLVGSKITLKVKNKAAGSTCTWKSSNTAAATVTKKGVVTAKAAGATVISCKVKAPNKTYTLKATVKVKSAVTVKTQKDLDKALANKGVTQIKIKTDAKSSFTIGEGSYKNKLLIVEAPNADITNSGTFKRIAIRSIKANTWFEKAKGNKFSVSAPESRIVVESSASVSKISFAKGAKKGAVEVKGAVKKVFVQAAMEVTLAGTASESTNVEVASSATGAKIVSSIPVKVMTSAAIRVELKAGAEGSAITITKLSVQIEVKNETAQGVTITDANGTQTTVNVGAEITIGITVDTGTGGSSSGGSSSGGSNSGGSSNGGSSSSKSSEKAIIKFEVNGQEGTIDEGNHTVKVSVASGTAINALKPVITVSTHAAISPASGEVVDFSKGDVTYTVTAQDGSTQEYTVTVTADGKEIISSEKQILSFEVTSLEGDDDLNLRLEKATLELDEETHTITFTVPHGMPHFPSFTPTITVSDKATVSPASGEAVDCRSGEDIIFTVTAEDGSTQEYTFTIKHEKCLSFMVSTATPASGNAIIIHPMTFMFNTKFGTEAYVTTTGSSITAGAEFMFSFDGYIGDTNKYHIETDDPGLRADYHSLYLLEDLSETKTYNIHVYNEDKTVVYELTFVVRFVKNEDEIPY